VSGQLLSLTGVGKRYGGFVALDQVSVSITAGERLGLIGPNGSGKSTLMSCISGTLEADAGTISFCGEELRGKPPHRRALMGIGRTFQIPRPFGNMSVLENVLVPLMYLTKRSGIGGGEADHSDAAYECLKLTGLEPIAHKEACTLSQIELRKLELARAMAGQPKLLICDEVMAGLAHNEVDEILRLLSVLNERKVAVIMIEHIIRAVIEFSQRIVVLVAGKIVADDDPQQVLRNPVVERAYLGS
jgi:branched-chain amino acid transport system ATP-binding protein